jgi:CBS domain-containing protein
MDTAGQLLGQKKTQDVCTIGPDAMVYDAIKMLADHNLGALIVTEHDRLVGVFTERDYARKIILRGRSSRTTRVRDIMSDHVIYVTPDTTLDTCMALMINKYIRHLPVLEGDRLIGIVSMGDAVKACLGEREFVIDQLVHYITGSPLVQSVSGHI